MAPTRPLISQQCAACIHILTLPPDTCIILDGHTPAPQRATHYQTHNFIFCTPQTLQNDLENGVLDGRSVVCVCVDEAHKATSNYAYTCIIAHLAQRQQAFRVLALTATPGRDMKSIQQVRVWKIVYVCVCGYV
ncbi:DEAD/DEAH box helicase [archaeon]|nr:MAG: DEAD/DEAH box helicase [archaeon]